MRRFAYATEAESATMNVDPRIHPAPCRGLLFAVLSMMLIAGLHAGQAADPLLPLTAGDLDAAACVAYVDGKAVAGNALPGLLVTLGLRAGEPWQAGEATASRVQYVVAFSKPQAIGALLLQGTGRIAILKPGATADPGLAASWLPVALPDSQAGYRLGTLAPGTTTRAVLMTLEAVSDRVGFSWEPWDSRFWQRFAYLRLCAPRLHNVLPDAVANAEAAWTETHGAAPPIVRSANSLVSGSGPWQSHGQDAEKNPIRRVPVSDLAPVWFAVSWDEAQQLSAVLLQSNFTAFTLYSYTGPAGVNPAVAGARDWAPVEFTARSDVGLATALPRVWLQLKKPLSTRGLKFVADGVIGERFGRIEALHVYADLRGAAVPSRQVVAREAPFAIPYALAQPASVSLAVEDAAGRRVRTLLMRAERSAGEQRQSWDLKDEQGRFVAPGAYRWKALANPGLAVQYVATPYPSISTTDPANSPWLNGESGPGGWLADHSPSRAVCAVGDRLFLSAPCAESGVALIECDLAGRKRWGRGNLMAWTGPSYMASDGTYLYCAPQADATDIIWRVALADHATDTSLQLPTTPSRPRGLRGLAVRDGKLFMSVSPAKRSWLDGAATAADVDIERCEPQYQALSASAKETDPDYREDFLRLFRLTGHAARSAAGADLSGDGQGTRRPAAPAARIQDCGAHRQPQLPAARRPQPAPEHQRAEGQRAVPAEPEQRGRLDRGVEREGRQRLDGGAGARAHRDPRAAPERRSRPRRAGRCHRQRSGQRGRRHRRPDGRAPCASRRRRVGQGLAGQAGGAEDPASPLR